MTSFGLLLTVICEFWLVTTTSVNW